MLRFFRLDVYFSFDCRVNNAMSRYQGIFQSVALACISSCLIALHAQAAEVPIPPCPAEIAVKQEVNAQIENGWKVANDNQSMGKSYPLRGIGFSVWEYPTIQPGFLIPSAEKSRKAPGRFSMITYFLH
jgi:hypothetical protein